MIYYGVLIRYCKYFTTDAADFGAPYRRRFAQTFADRMVPLWQ